MPNRTSYPYRICKTNKHFPAAPASPPAGNSPASGMPALPGWKLPGAILVPFCFGAYKAGFTYELLNPIQKLFSVRGLFRKQKLRSIHINPGTPEADAFNFKKSALMEPCFSREQDFSTLPEHAMPRKPLCL